MFLPPPITRSKKQIHDDDDNGTVELSEFPEMKTCKMGEKDSREDTEKIFKLFDDDKISTGSPSSTSSRVAEDLGENIDDDATKSRSPRLTMMAPA